MESIAAIQIARELEAPKKLIADIQLTKVYVDLIAKLAKLIGNECIFTPMKKAKKLEMKAVDVGHVSMLRVIIPYRGMVRGEFWGDDKFFNQIRKLTQKGESVNLKIGPRPKKAVAVFENGDKLYADTTDYSCSVNPKVPNIDFLDRYKVQMSDTSRLLAMDKREEHLITLCHEDGKLIATCYKDTTLFGDIVFSTVIGKKSKSLDPKETFKRCAYDADFLIPFLKMLRTMKKNLELNFDLRNTYPLKLWTIIDEARVDFFLAPPGRGRLNYHKPNV